jgi:AcrR family transcriptional regulator
MTAATRRGPGRPRDTAADAAILEAAIDELIDRGFIAASMESVAARAGVAKTTLYRRWSSMTELGLAAMRTLQEDPSLAAGESVRSDLLVQLDQMRRKWGNPRYAALMRRVAADGSAQPDMYKQCRDELIAPYVRRLNSVIERGIDEGLIRSDVDVTAVRSILTAPIMAAALTLRERYSRAKLEFLVDTVLAGLAPSAQWARADTDPASSRRERVEPEEPVHRLGGRRSDGGR